MVANVAQCARQDLSLNILRMWLGGCITPSYIGHMCLHNVAHFMPSGMLVGWLAQCCASDALTTSVFTN